LKQRQICAVAGKPKDMIEDPCTSLIKETDDQLLNSLGLPVGCGIFFDKENQKEGTSMTIQRASRQDLPAILKLQYKAYESEARLLNNWNIPPLKQTLAEVEAEFDRGAILKAVDETGAIIGSVRAWEEKDTVYVGKLMVHPENQGKGIGTKLLLAVEEVFPGKRYELFTSTQSARNIALYQRCGYRIFTEKQVNEALRFVYLEKM